MAVVSSAPSPLGAAQLGDTPRVRAELRALALEVDARRARLPPLIASVLRFTDGLSSLSPSVSLSPSSLSLSSSSLLEEVPAQVGADLAASLSQLDDVAINFGAQIRRAVVAPLQELQTAADLALRRARALDEETEALEAAQRSYISCSRDSPVDARAAAYQDVEDRRASASAAMLETKVTLRDARSGLASAPQRAVAEFLVAQLAYYQSCARILTAQVPRITAMLKVACCCPHLALQCLRNRRGVLQLLMVWYVPLVLQASDTEEASLANAVRLESVVRQAHLEPKVSASHTRHTALSLVPPLQCNRKPRLLNVASSWLEMLTHATYLPSRRLGARCDSRSSVRWMAS